MKKWLNILLIVYFTTLPSFAYEDYLIINNEKLTDIKIEDNSIIDVYPMVTIANDKNILIVRPLRVGKTKFCALKNNKDVILFNVDVKEDETIIDNVNGFDILSIDKPNNYSGIQIDLPPNKFPWQEESLE